MASTACCGTILSIVLTVSSPSHLHAVQTVGTMAGDVLGTVSDQTGAVLEGVAIEIAGSAMMGRRVAVTSRRGEYRFPALPTGDYTLLFALAGFTSVSRSVSVAASMTRTVDAVLILAALEDRVTVQPPLSTIDRHSTTVSTSFGGRELDSLPGVRSILGILAATPGVQLTRFDPGGNATGPGGGTGLSAYGTAGGNRPTVEGILVAGVLDTGFNFNHGAFGEISVVTAGHGAEWQTPGVHTQFIGKSGGNQYRGTLYADYQNSAWQAINIDRDQIQRGVTGGGGLSADETNRLSAYHDLNADIGGYLRRDTVWWYSSVRDQKIAARLVSFPVKPHETRHTSYSGKWTYRPASNHTIVGFLQMGRNHEPNRLDGFTLPAPTAINIAENSTTDHHSWGRVWKAEWNGVLRDRVYFEVRAGEFTTRRSEEPRGTGDRFEDSETKIVRGGNRDWQRDLRRPQASGSLSYFKDGWRGTHHFKVGGSVIRNTNIDTWRNGYPRDVLHAEADGSSSQVYLFQTPSKSENGLWIYSGYANDSWRPVDRLTLSLGARFDRYRVFLPAQQHGIDAFAAVSNVIDWDVIAPRLGAVYNLKGNGRTLLKVSYGQYWIAPGDLGANVNPNSNDWWILYRWDDLDGSGHWSPGEELQPPLRRRGGAASESLDPALELPYVREVAGWIEHDFPGDVGGRFGVVWRGARQPFTRQDRNRPFSTFTRTTTVFDPGPDGRSGTTDDGSDILVDDVESGGAGRENVVRNVPGADAEYWTLETAASKRFSRRWSLVAGFAHTWSRDHAAGYLGQPVRENAYPLTPNDLINADSDGRHAFTTWTAKVHGTYEAPWRVRITPMLRHQSGQPYGRTVRAELTYGTVPILVEPVGTRRQDNVTIVDTRVEKEFRLRGGQQAAVFVDVFNLLNANPEQNIIWSSESFRRPVSIVAPRTLRLGARLEW